MNEHTGQTLTITKKQFSADYHVLLFTGQQTDEKESKTISPDFPTESKAESFALKLMDKHPDGIT